MGTDFYPQCALETYANFKAYNLFRFTAIENLLTMGILTLLSKHLGKALGHEVK